MKNKYLGGAVVIVIASLIAKLIGAIYRIPLSNILGTEAMGVYQLAFPIYSFLLIIVAGGLPVVISKMIAEARASKDYAKATSVFEKSFFICVIAGGIFSLSLFFFAENLAYLQGNLKVINAYSAMSVAIFFACMSSSLKSLFQGYQNMVPSSLSAILEQIIKLVFGLFFAQQFLPQGITQAVFGATLGIALSEFLSFLYLISTVLLKKKKYHLTKEYNKPKVFKEIIKLSTPVTFGAIIFPLCAILDSFFVINILKTYMETSVATSLFGIQTGMITPIINLPNIVCLAISVAMLPNLAFAIKENDVQKSQNIINNTFKFVWCFILASIVGLVVLSENILKILFPVVLNNYIKTAVILLIISAVGTIFLAIAQTCTTVMQANGEMSKPTKNLFFSAMLKILLTFSLLFIPEINIYAVAIANSISYLIYCLLNLLSLKKGLQLSLPTKKLFAPIMSAIIMGLLVILSTYLLETLPLIINVFVSIFVGVVTYILLLFVFKVFSLKSAISLLKSSKNRLLKKKILDE